MTERRSARPQNDECRIDSFAQTWSVLSGAGDARARRARRWPRSTASGRRDDRGIQLFDPPFDKSPLDPGYIKGYVPGVRENGGQYTHAAIWAVMAFAEMGDGDARLGAFDMLNPINHAVDPGGGRGYKVEPYVVAADVYGVRRMRAAAAGPGTPARPAGCTARDRIAARPAPRGRALRSRHACRTLGRRLRRPIATARPNTR